jgi:hypothetical protein
MATTQQQLEAWNKPVDGPYHDFAIEVRKLLGYEPGGTRPYLSTRAAAIKTNVNSTTISTMLRGIRPSEESIQKFAEAFKVDTNHLLRLAGHLVIASEAQGSRAEVLPHSTEIERVPFDTDDDMIEYLKGRAEHIDPRRKAIIREIFADDDREEVTHGKRAE